MKPIREGAAACPIPSKRARLSQAVLSLTALVAMSPAHALQIEFDYTYDVRGFFTDVNTGAPIAERRAVLDLAASFYAGFTDRLAAIAPAAGDHWSVSITHPSLAGPAVLLEDLQIPAGTLRVFAGGSSSAPGVLGFAGTGDGLQATGSATFVDAVSGRGQENTVGPDATDYGTWGGYIWFNAAQDWHFGSAPPSVGSTQPDFLTTALHELGHLLGFGEADSWFTLVDAATQQFTGAASVDAHGGPVPLDRFLSHWGSGVSSTVDGVAQQTLMDPSTVRGTRELPTALDYAGFRDIGWNVPMSPVPLPAPVLLLAAGLMPLVAATRTRRDRALQS
ncbi:MAG: PEP-CTERM sorting domain-containing protein [Gammaproteobacteria bacterium]